MKVLHVGKYLPPVPGGMETSVLQLCEGLSLHPDINIHCLVSNNRFSTVQETLGKVSVTRAARLLTIASTPMCPTFRREGLKVEADLYHFHLPNPLATFSFRECPKPYVVTYHCDIVRYKKILSLYRPSMVEFLRRAQRVVVTSQELLNSSEGLAGVKDNCTVIPLGLEPSYLKPSAERNNQTKQLRQKFGERIVLFVGRIVPYKGLNDLINAMKTVQGHLIIVGEGPQRAALQNLVHEQGLDKKVALTGYISDQEIGSYYHAASLVALTSKNESEAFGMCLLEGLACRKPLLTTRLNTGVGSVNLEGVTGLHVDVGDVAGISKGLNEILDDPARGAEMGEKGYQHFVKNFEREAVARSYLSLYKQVI